jgi:apolipoprotein N-acyltransferase
MNGRTSLLKAGAASLCSAALLIASFPSLSCWPLIFLSLLPFFFAVENQGWKRGAVLGLILGMVFQTYLMFWCSFFGVIPVSALALYRAYPYAILGAILGALPAAQNPKQQASKALLISGLWIALEYYISCGPLGATWGMIGHSLSRQTALIQICSVGGPWILSYLVVLVSALALPVFRKQLHPGFLSVAIVLNVISGLWGQSRILPSMSNGAQLCVGAVQGNMGRDIKWDPNFAEIALKGLEDLSLQSAQSGARIVVWPETSIPYRGFRKHMGLTTRLGNLGLMTQSHLLVGSIEMVDDEDRHTRNTMSLISPEGGFEGHYEKQRLVAWGEYLPLESWCRNYKVFDRVMRFQPGTTDGLLTCKNVQFKGNSAESSRNAGDLKVGILICFESMVPDIARQRALAGADLLSVSTNDGWFGDSSAIVHHFEMGIFRAVECGLPLVQSGNTGLSGLIDCYGRVKKVTGPNEKTHVEAVIGLENLPTLYRRLGDWFPVFAILLGLGAFGATRKQSPTV